MTTSSDLSPLPGFAQGAVPPARASALTARLNELHGDYPISRHHRYLVRQLGGEYVYARALGGRFQGRWMALVRFGEVIEKRFGISAEVPLIYDHFDDLQIRTVDSIDEYLAQLPPERRSVTAEISLLSSPDPQSVEKASRWSRPGRLLIPLPRSVQATASDLLASISRLVFSRDLYSVRGAVTGRHFFGRQRLLAAVLDDVDHFRVPGVFGMRKTGKTSLLQELMRSGQQMDRSAGRQRAFVYQDLEHLSGFEGGDPVAELVTDLAESIRSTLKAAKMRTREVADLSATVTLPEFRAALDALLARLEPGEEVVLLLDEIEYLCPPHAESLPRGSKTEKVAQLFGVLRKLVQERGNFGLVISGLASSSVEASELFGRPNPLFSFAHPYYLGPFSEEEATDLLRGVGKQVGLTWRDDAVELAIAETGGSAMLLRELGSSVLKSYPTTRVDLATVGRDDVAQVLAEWRRAVSSNLREVVLHLRRFYEEESALIDVLMSSPSDFDELSYDYPDQVHRLSQLGVIEPVGSGWVPSRVLQMGWELVARPSQSGAGSVAPGAVAEDGSLEALLRLPIEDLIAHGESTHLEFKESATFNAHKGGKDKELERAVIKTVAGFMNAEGGMLVVGVHDDCSIVGIERDIRVVSQRKDIDGFENWFVTLLKNNLGAACVASGVRVVIEAGDEGKVVCRAEVRRSSSPVYVGEAAEFFVRMGNSTRLLNTREAMDYVRDRFVIG